jgi:hypothetical protein
MKYLFLFFLFPLFSKSQTVHIKDEKIEYEGRVTVNGLSASEIGIRIQKILNGAIDDPTRHVIKEEEKGKIKAEGEMRLTTPYSFIRTVFYTIKITPVNKGYTYFLDNVFLKEQERGKEVKSKSSKELLEEMGEAGKTVIDTEKILNEIDMRIQQLLATIKSKMMLSAPGKNK